MREFDEISTPLLIGCFALVAIHIVSLNKPKDFVCTEPMMPQFFLCLRCTPSCSQNILRLLLHIGQWAVFAQ